MGGVANAKTLKWQGTRDPPSPSHTHHETGRGREGQISQMELDHFQYGGHKQDFRILAPWQKWGETSNGVLRQ